MILGKLSRRYAKAFFELRAQETRLSKQLAKTLGSPAMERFLDSLSGPAQLR